MGMEEVAVLERELNGLEEKFEQDKAIWAVKEKNTILYEVNLNYRKIVRCGMEHEDRRQEYSVLQKLIERNEALYQKIDQYQL